MARVMISYRNIDGQRDFAFSLEKALADAGIETWLDVKDIPRLSLWEDEIFKGIIDSDYVVLCLSPEYFESETCRFECYVARGYGKTILPLIVANDTSASVFARNAIVPADVSTIFCPSTGEIMRGAFPVRAVNSADVPGKNGGGNFLGTPARRKIDNNSVGQNS